ncbi:DivIVA domain-containing protein [Kribbella deserti]|uniref:DivIVA domain-containing protein n=1 Tax=Kribbella deserti TaxID=1926257 RepID=A0ABV6QWX8_9ACTN
MWFFALVIVVLIGAVAVVASGRWGGMAEVYDDRPDVLVPARRALTADDIESSRFGVGVRGYRMDEVDTLLERVAREVAERDRRIEALERAHQTPAYAYPEDEPLPTPAAASAEVAAGPVAETPEPELPAETPHAEAGEPGEPAAPESSEPSTVTPVMDEAGTVSTEVYDAGSIFAAEPEPEPRREPGSERAANGAEADAGPERAAEGVQAGDDEPASRRH